MRQTVLSIVAFEDFKQLLAQDSPDTAIECFLTRINSEGWQLPETLRLSDYGLGHDDRAKEHQPVRECFGPRFYDWQLEQTPEESWAECHLHARNLLGQAAYEQLLNDEPTVEASSEVEPSSVSEEEKPFQLTGVPKKSRRRG